MKDQNRMTRKVVNKSSTHQDSLWSDSSDVKAQSSSSYEPPFLLISSHGPAADFQSLVFGLYHKTKEMREGKSIYVQENDIPCDTVQLFSDNGAWVVKNTNDEVLLRADTLTHPVRAQPLSSGGILMIMTSEILYSSMTKRLP